jgi:hypothetical protein
MAESSLQLIRWNITGTSFNTTVYRWFCFILRCAICSLERVKNTIKEPLLYLPFDELCVVAHETCKNYVIDNGDADIDYDE